MTKMLLTLTLLLAGSGHATADDDVRAKLAAYLDEAAAQGFIGVALVTRGDEILLAQGHGTLSASGDAPVTIDSVSTMGSITKQFTAAAVMKLASEGRLSTDDTLAKYFDDVPAGKAGITLHQLLSHQAGFPGAIGRDDERIGRDAFVARALATDLLFEPGTAYEYSNVGFSLAAAIVELVSGQRYEDYLATALLEPAGMQDTGYTRPEFDPDDIAVGRREDGSDWGTVLGRAIADGGPGWHLLGNGGLHTTAPDMLAWHRALRDGTVLPAASTERLYGRYADEGGGTWYGYGWSIEPTTWGGELVAHNGGNPYYFADFLRFLESDVMVYLWTVSPDRRMHDIARPLARIVLTGDAPPLPAPPSPLQPVGERDPDAENPALRWGFPATVVGLRAGQLTELLLGTDAAAKPAIVTAAFDAGVIERNGVDGLLELFERLRGDFAPLELQGMRMQGADEVGVVFDSMKGRLTLLGPLGDGPERQVAGLGVEVN